jgi:hypothetical protein
MRTAKKDQGWWLMPKIKLDSVPVMYEKVGKITDPSIKDVAQEIRDRAIENLAIARATSDTPKLADLGGLTTIGLDVATPTSARNAYANDYLVTMSAPQGGAMAIEMGHSPSGVFAGTDTRAPRGLYILSRAAGLLGLPRFRKK